MCMSCNLDIFYSFVCTTAQKQYCVDLLLQNRWFCFYFLLFVLLSAWNTCSNNTKSLDPSKAKKKKKKTFIKHLGHTVVSAIQASSVTFQIWQMEPKKPVNLQILTRQGDFYGRHTVQHPAAVITNDTKNGYLREKKTFTRKQVGHSTVSAIQAPSVTL